MKRVILYINQFFGGIGGEEYVEYEPEFRIGAAGPGQAIQKELMDAEITHTIICGDNFMASHRDKAIEKIGRFLEDKEFDLFLAGPAFQAGRYGTNCGEVCKFIKESYNVPTLTSMNEENPGVDAYREDTIIIRGGNSSAKMRRDARRIAELANVILSGGELPSANVGGYFHRGKRKQIFTDKLPGERAVEMLLAKLSGKPYQTEYIIEKHERVTPAKAIDAKKSKIALITSGGLVPEDNPDHIPSATATVWGRYDISELDAFYTGKFISVHGGYNVENVNNDPEVQLPLATVKKLVKEERIGELHSYYYATTGNCTTIADARTMARQMLLQLKADDVDGVIFVST